ncbi:beta-1,3-galactosyl-O-glycosyl-glycoprotein beta-1,6-N-acetylglucosaminyltransferase-like [Pungitius pungitius]|uniref:beta-1,3-galactosyl-O-glycosyl-glycoprotein beta-1,6-N-acetylglucosaminyltransferase-like n=1 Tax=Pungitius pungitius TaxID=134920 RepID=UPI002E10266C
MRLTKKSCLLLVIVGVIVLWMFFPLHPLDLWGSKHIYSYSWLNYSDADGGPENKCDCPAILQGDSKALEQAKTLTSTKDFQKSITIPNEYYINASQDCRNFKASRKYLTIPLSRVEEDFPLAYSVVVHHKVQNFERLLRAIYAPQNIYCVHVDKKSDASVYSAIGAITSCFPNVFTSTLWLTMVYAAWPRVQADINCMADLYNAKTKWKYFINLCGQDFPLKTNLEIVNALLSLRGDNSMESEQMPEGKKDRVTHTYKIVNGQNQPTGNEKEPPPFNLPILTGSAYIVVNRGYVRSVLEDSRIPALIEWSKDTFIPDETFWATIQRLPGVPGSKRPHPKYDMTDMNAIVRMVKWQGHEGTVYPECHGHHVRDVCVYGFGDVQWLLQQHHLFANKFDTDIDPIAVYCLEKYLREKALAELF